MKRMNEVFELPVKLDFDFEHDWSAEDEGDDICLSGFDPIASGNKVVLLAVASSKTYGGVDSMVANIAQHAAHAINHVDALYDALQALFDDYKGLADSGDAGYWKLEETDAGMKAIAALKAYRGEK